MIVGGFALLFLPAAGLKWVDAARGAGTYDLAHTASAVEIYEGEPVRDEEEIEEYGEPEMVVTSLERIRGAGLVLSINGAPVAKMRLEEVYEVAPPPSGVSTGYGDGIENAVLRQLTSLELDEIQRALNPEGGFWHRYGFWLIVPYLGAALLLGALENDNAWWKAAGLGGSAILIMLALYVAWRLLRDKLQLRADAARAEVLRFEDDGERLEVLPVSRKIWTVDSEPADWRWLVSGRMRA